MLNEGTATRKVVHLCSGPHSSPPLGPHISIISLLHGIFVFPWATNVFPFTLKNNLEPLFLKEDGLLCDGFPFSYHLVLSLPNSTCAVLTSCFFCLTIHVNLVEHEYYLFQSMDLSVQKVQALLCL